MDNRNFLADIEFNLEWETSHSLHAETYFGAKVNFWRDCFPSRLYQDLMQAGPNDRIDWKPEKNEMIDVFTETKVFPVKRSQFGTPGQSRADIVPRTGRFYPKGLLRGVAHVFPGNMQPFRMREVEDERLVADFNHPLAGRSVNVSLKIQDMWRKDREKGGTCYDWLETVADGPGMQARINGAPTDFGSPHGHARPDESPDELFYQEPRMVHHVDEAARSVIRKLYAEKLRPGMNVLDLMASWESHIDPELKLDALVGVGLNRQELSANPQLSEYHVQDLNRSMDLPYSPETFDAVICTNSIEYLTDPRQMFQVVADLLKPGGIFMAVFSNRWFPAKVTRLWTELHEFERMGLVAEYFWQSGRFGDVHTRSVRGLPRPIDDKYFPGLRLSDPVYAVWASKVS